MYRKSYTKYENMKAFIVTLFYSDLHSRSYLFGVGFRMIDSLPENAFVSLFRAKARH